MSGRKITRRHIVIIRLLIVKIKRFNKEYTFKRTVLYENLQTHFNNNRHSRGGVCYRVLRVYMGCCKMTKRRFIVYTVLCATVILASAILGVVFFPASYVKFGLSCASIFKSFIYYWAEMFGVNSPFLPTAGDLPPTTEVEIIPSTPEGFSTQWSRFCELFITKTNFFGYIGLIGTGITNILFFALFIIPIVLILWIVFRSASKTVKTGDLSESKALAMYKWLRRRALQPAVREIKIFVRYFRAHRIYTIPTGLLWAFNLNLPTIVVGLFAWYFYFMGSFDFVSVYTNIVRLFDDLKTFFSFMPWWAYVIAAVCIFNVWRKHIALDRLWHMELMNRGFLNSLPISSFVIGTMGKGKTTMLTDMALSRQVMFRDKAFEKLKEYMNKLPDFPWLRFEREIQRAIEHGSVYNLATCRRFVRGKRYKFYRNVIVKRRLQKLYFFGYDGKLYYDDKLQVTDAFTLLENYAQLYFIYIVASSLIVSNYSIRDDEQLSSMGNFPMWCNDFFSGDSLTLDSRSRYSHILDFDILRLGKKIIENNPHAGSFEFGVLGITEVGKERGNQNDTKGRGIKYDDPTANRLNDGFNRWVKLCRHSSTVDNFPFVSIYLDDQRPESLGADAKELCTLLHIRESSEPMNALPFFWVYDWLYKLLYSRLMGKYMSHRYRRNDETLPSYFVHRIASWLYVRRARMMNLYGYKVQSIDIEAGTQNGNFVPEKYFLMFKKIYAKRFDTACFADIFAKQSIETRGGVDKYPEYADVRASMDELREQNSYFIDEIDN